MPAQPTDPANGLLLIAKPSLADPRFRRTVVLVTQTPDASTVGVVLNRPTTLALGKFLAPGAPSHNYRDSLYWGGPVMPQVIIALFASDAPPSAGAFHVHKGFYLSMEPRNVEALLADSGARYRLYAGFSGWLPGQLGQELERDGWYLMPVEEEILFRKDTSRLWEELVARVGGTHAAGNRKPRLSGARIPDSPGGAAVAALVFRGIAPRFGVRSAPRPSSRRFGFAQYPDGRPDSRAPRNRGTRSRLHTPGSKLARAIFLSRPLPSVRHSRSGRIGVPERGAALYWLQLDR